MDSTSYDQSPEKIQDNDHHHPLMLSTFQGHILYLVQDRVGSDTLASLLDQRLLSESEIDLIISEISCALFELMKNPFGSHFMEKLFGACNSNQLTWIVSDLTADHYLFAAICVNSYGAKAMQVLLEKLTTQFQMRLIMFELRYLGIALSFDRYGHHIVNYCLRNFPLQNHFPVFYLDMARNCYDVATNKNGCIVLKSCLDFSSGAAKELLIRCIVADALELAQCPYGNYVVQHLIELGIPEFTQLLIMELEGNFEILSRDKFASNVVQKIISFSGHPFSSAVIKELLNCRDFSSLANDPYANYVVQSALSASKRGLRNALVITIRSHRRSMEMNRFGKKVLKWLQKNSN